MENKNILFLDIRSVNGLNSFGTINGRDAYNNYFAVGIGYLY